MSADSSPEELRQLAGSMLALSYLLVDPTDHAQRALLASMAASEPGGTAAMLLGLIDLADDVFLTHLEVGQWNRTLDDYLAQPAADGVTPDAFTGHKRALALLRLHDSPRAARTVLAAATGTRPLVWEAAVQRLAEAIDTFHAADRPDWRLTLERRIRSQLERSTAHRVDPHTALTTLLEKGF